MLCIKYDAIIRLIHMPLRMCRGRDVSLQNRYRYVVSDHELNEGLKPPLAKSFRRFNPKIQAFKHVLDMT